MSNDSYDIFISYRRENGASTAKHLRDILTSKGYRVFFDTDSLRSGDFNRELLDVIKKCTDFIIILSPNALDRCVNEQDWVRQELACALENGKNIIPVMSDKFVFPETLPNDVDGIRWKNGIAVNIEYFDAMVEKLISFLKSKPHRNKKFIWMIAGIAACAVIALALIFFFKSGRDDEEGAGSAAGDPVVKASKDDKTLTTGDPIDPGKEELSGSETDGTATEGVAEEKVASDKEEDLTVNISVEGKTFNFMPISSYKDAEYYGDYVPRGTAIVKDKSGNKYTAVANSLVLGQRNTMYQGFFSEIHDNAPMFSEPEYSFLNGVSFHQMFALQGKDGEFKIIVGGGYTNMTLPDNGEDYYLYFIEEGAVDEITKLNVNEIGDIEFKWHTTPETNLKYCTVKTDDDYVFRVPVAHFWFAVNKGSNYPLVYVQHDLQPLVDKAESISDIKSITSESREEEDGKTPYLTVTYSNGDTREVKCDRYFAYYIIGTDGALIRMHAWDIVELKMD